MEPGTRAVCVREVQGSLRDSSKQLIEDKIRQYKAQKYFDIRNAFIRTPGSGIIIFRGMSHATADSLKSLEDFRIAWVDEAQRLKANSWKKLRPTIRARGSQIWASWNPDQSTDPVDDFYRHAPKDLARCVTVTWRDNPWFPEELEQERVYDQGRDIDTYNHVWEGAYDEKSEARVFKRWRVGTREEFEKLDRSLLLYGVDFGFANDPTVAIEAVPVGRTLYITGEAWKIGLEIDHIPAFFNAHLPDMKSRVIRADGARPETISYLRRNGFQSIQAAIKGPGSIKEGVEFLKSYDIVAHPDCVHVINELTHFKYKVDEKTGLVLPVLPDKQNHTIDAIRYLAERLRRRRRGVF